MNSPAVSVVMPVFNGAAFLARAVESVRRQTFPHWELLAVDDGSADAKRRTPRRAGRRYALLNPFGG